ncbi:MAG TPA: DegT/DnrJ/EryC1/StrS family aminotransferase [Caulobacteraceae bacterium]|nr:DegT/DnrJ/EryC1/StrS family aminotransferase [Caulobacteraceae bacterium]
MARAALRLERDRGEPDRFGRVRDELARLPPRPAGGRGEETLFVTRPLLPPLTEFLPYLAEIWQSRQLTNGGPFHAQLEAELAAHLGVEHLALFANGTLALMTALKALAVEGEAITTPYSFVATAHSLLWNNITPVFADVDSATCNLDPERVAAAITPRTSAILAVHCYGAPCDVEAIGAIARENELKVIYDAAHAFGVKHRGQSLLRHGDMAVLSFHATKVFHTFEGGAIVCPDADAKRRVDFLKNFGFADEVTIEDCGINGKMNEVQAAMGLLQLKHVDRAIERRAAIDAFYRRALAGAPGIEMLAPIPGHTPNYSYFPILVDPAWRGGREALYARLRQASVHGRRYFYPLISDMPMYRDLPSAAPENLPRARALAEKILCLPIYPDLEAHEAQRVVDAITG